MSHVDPGRLWALSRGELGEADEAQVQGHLAACPGCRASLARIERARPMMMPPQVPDLGVDRWRAIDDQVFEAVAREMRRPRFSRLVRSWWDAPLFKPALAAAALVGTVLAVAELGLPGAGPTPDPIAAAAERQASVISAVESVSGSAALLADRKLERGAIIEARQQGEAWLRLPDGTRLGVLPASTAKLEELEPKSLRISLAKGAVAVAAAHEPERLLEVRAGRLVVRVVGTRFMVLRDGETSAVVVEEGIVEAEVDGKVEMVPAGTSLTVTSRGAEVGAVAEPERRQLEEMVPSRPAGQPKPKRALAAAAASPARSAAVPAEPTAPPEDPKVDDAWAELPPPSTSLEPPEIRAAEEPALTPPPPPPETAPTAAPDAKAGPTYQSWLQRQLDNLDRAHCKRVFAKVDEMTTRWAPGTGVVMTERRKRLLADALKERERCIRSWGYPAPR